MDAPTPDRAEPVERLHGARQGDHHRGNHERDAQGRIHSGDEHVVSPHDEPQPRDAGNRIDHRPVAEQRLAGKRGHDVGDHPHRRQDHDVDGGVAVEPEEMLPEQRLATTGRLHGVVDDIPLRREEPGPEGAIGQLHKPGGGEHGEGKGLQDGGDKHRPDRHRQAKHRHARSPHEDDRGHVVDATEHGRHAHKRQPHKPERLPHASAR